MLVEAIAIATVIVVADIPVQSVVHLDPIVQRFPEVTTTTIIAIITVPATVIVIAIGGVLQPVPLAVEQPVLQIPSLSVIANSFFGGSV